MTDQNPPNDTDSARLAQILAQLSITQLRYVVARNDSKSDREAAETIGISPATVKGWESKALVDEAVRLMLFDGVITAREIRRRNLAKAMAVKVAGLDSNDERTRQNVATEIIEWELGTATQRQEVSGRDGDEIKIAVSIAGRDE